LSIVRTLALAIIVLWQLHADSATAPLAPACAVTPQALQALPGRVDGLQAAGATGKVLALVGRSGSQVRFLPDDVLDILDPTHAPARVQTIGLPAYLTAPGLAARLDGARLYVLEDSGLLTLDGGTGAVLARQALPLQAIGWPAAITADSNSVYLIGQPGNAWTAQAYAMVPDAKGVLRVRWRMSLGLTHAGSWVGLAGDRQLAIYLPDAHDEHGTVLLVDRAHGTQRRAYGVPSPPVGADARTDRLFLADAGMIRSLSLRGGAAVTAMPGVTPLAVDATRGVVAYLRADHLVVADTDRLRSLLVLPFPAHELPTALAWQGSRLLVGTASGVRSLLIGACL